MYRLKVLSVPNQSELNVGESIDISRGECTIGRHSENKIILNSGNVSKRHAILVVDNTKIVVKDNGSSNGTFVNGELTKSRDLKVGDKLSVGEFIFELKNQVEKNQSFNAPSTPQKTKKKSANHLTSVPVSQDSFSPAFGTHSLNEMPSEMAPPPSLEPMPTSLVGKLKYSFDHKVIPYFFDLNTKHEWRVLSIGLVGIFLLISSLIGVWPLISAHEEEFLKELERKAKMVAIEVAERNSNAVATRQDSKTDIGTFSRALSNGIRRVYVLDLDLKIIAPADRAGQVLGSGEEASFINKARSVYSERLDDDKKTGRTVRLSNGSIVAVEPIRAFSNKVLKNVVVGLAAVIIDSDSAMISGSELALAYGYSVIIAAFVGLLIFYILYRVTIKPIEEMNLKIDQALRGEFVEFKSSTLFEEMDPLWNVMHSAIQRLPKVDSENGLSGGSQYSAEDLLNSLKSLADVSFDPTALLNEEKNFVHLNTKFEEITGIRSDSNLGQAIQFAARDQGFISCVEDLFNRVIPGGEAVTESFEFSGVNYKVSCLAFGSMGSLKAYLLSLVKEEQF